MTNMRSRQTGVSLGPLAAGLFVVIVLALLAMRVAPAYMEFSSAKSAIESIARERQGATVNDIRKAFDARAQIDDITAVKAQDLDITKEGGEVVISFAYRKDVPLFRNIGLFFDFAANSKGQ